MRWNATVSFAYRRHAVGWDGASSVRHRRRQADAQCVREKALRVETSVRGPVELVACICEHDASGKVHDVRVNVLQIDTMLPKAEGRSRWVPG